LFDEADRVLAEAVEASLTRGQIGLPPPEETASPGLEDVDEAI